MHRGSQLDEEDEADEEAEDEEEKEKEKEREEEDEEKRKAADIKSNNPHLAGGEKKNEQIAWNNFKQERKRSVEPTLITKHRDIDRRMDGWTDE